MLAAAVLWALGYAQVPVTKDQCAGVYAKFKSLGYECQAPRGAKAGLLSKGNGRAAFGIESVVRDDWPKATSVSLEARLLLPEGADRVEVQKLVPPDTESDLKLWVQVDDVVKVKTSAWGDSKTELQMGLDRFWKACDILRSRFHATNVDPRSTSDGRFPPDSMSLIGLCFDDLIVLRDKWGWNWRPHRVLKPPKGVIEFLKDDGVGFSGVPVTVDGVDMEIRASDPWPDAYLRIEAEVPVDKGADAVALSKRLEASIPLIKSEKPEDVLEQGRVLETASVSFFGRNPTQFPSYSDSLSFKLRNMTVGKFRERVRWFAARVKALPHR